MTARALSLSLAIIMGGALAAGGAFHPLAAQEPQMPPLPGPPRTAPDAPPIRQMPKSERQLINECRQAYDVRDYSTAEAACLPIAEDGNVLAQRTLGMIYLSGYGTFRTEVQAEKWIRKAALAGDAQAQFTLGTMYLHGVGVTKIEKTAAEWILKAAEQRHLEAQETIAYMYLVGQGVPQRDDLALHWYKRAADAGYPKAQYNLGILYHKGQAVPRNESQALYWIRRAAANGSKDAEVFLEDVDPRRK